MPVGLNVGFGHMLQFFVKLIHLDRITGLSREQDGLGIEKQSGSGDMVGVMKLMDMYI